MRQRVLELWVTQMLLGVLMAGQGRGAGLLLRVGGARQRGALRVRVLAFLLLLLLLQLLLLLLKVLLLVMLMLLVLSVHHHLLLLLLT